MIEVYDLQYDHNFCNDATHKRFIVTECLGDFTGMDMFVASRNNNFNSMSVTEIVLPTFLVEARCKHGALLEGKVYLSKRQNWFFYVKEIL